MASKLKKPVVQPPKHTKPLPHLSPAQEKHIREKLLPSAKQFKKGEIHNPAGRPPKAFFIPDILKKIGEEWCPIVIAGELRKTFPMIGTISTREAWLRVVYLEAIGGEEWASKFIADRTEGKIREASPSDNKGAILDGIDKLLED